MKKSIYLAALSMLFLVSCAPKLHYAASTSYVDYNNYAKQGMFISESNSVSFDYVPLGSVSVTVLSGEVSQVAKKVTNSDKIADPLYSKAEQKIKSGNKWKSADINDAIQMAVLEAKERGGNGIINLKIEPFSDISKNASRTGYLVTGMVISKK